MTEKKEAIEVLHKEDTTKGTPAHPDTKTHKKSRTGRRRAAAKAFIALNVARMVLSAAAAASSVAAMFRIIELGTPPVLVFRFLTNWSVALHIAACLLTVATAVESIATTLFGRPDGAVRPVDTLTRTTEAVHAVASSLCTMVSLTFWGTVRLAGGPEAVLSPEFCTETLLMHQQHTVPALSLLVDGLLFQHTNFFGLAKEAGMTCLTVVLYGVATLTCAGLWGLDAIWATSPGFCGTLRWPYPFLEKLTNVGKACFGIALIGLTVFGSFVSMSCRAIHAIATTKGHVTRPLDAATPASQSRRKATKAKQN